MTDQDCRDGNCAPCDLREFERNRYFDGKLLVTRDFTDEQAYHTRKHRLHNSMLHGYGTVCGLKVVEHVNPACQNQFVVLRPGLALDCCGNEISVPDKVVIDIRHEIELALRRVNRFPAEGTPGITNVYLRLAYRECDVEPIAALLDDCDGCDDTDTEFNRTREGYRVFVDVDDPVGAAGDPLEARLEWNQTLEVAQPRGFIIDRDSQRLYVVDWNGNEGGLRVYNAEHHSLTVRVAISEPTAVARSLLGDRVFVALAGDGSGQIDIYDQSALEHDTANALRASLKKGLDANIVRLEASPLDNSLYALLSDGTVLRWSSDVLDTWVGAGGVGNQPEPAVRKLADAANTGGTAVAPNDMTISVDGRWMVVSDSGTARLIVVNLAAFADATDWGKAFPMPEVPTAIDLSNDGIFLYVLSSADADNQKLYRIEVRPRLEDYIPVISFTGEPQTFSLLPLSDPAVANQTALAIDVAVTPRDSWVYILRRLSDETGAALDRGEVVIVSVDALETLRGRTTILPPVDGLKLIRTGSSVEDSAQFQNLAFLGQRLYVAGETPVKDGAATAGSISVLEVNEATCGTYIRRTIDGCVTCDSPEDGVILMSISQYVWDQRIVDTAPGATEKNLIDNFTYRHLLPSTDTLRQVIECMLDQGFNEGVPGPRGPQGTRGPSILQVALTTPTGGLPSAGITPIPGDPEGDLRLNLTLPVTPGPRGPGIQAIALTVPNTGTPSASLSAIPGDPENDLRLNLVIPVPPAQIPTLDLNQVTDATWTHGVGLSPTELANLFLNTGLLVTVKNELVPTTVNDLSVEVSIRRPDPLMVGNTAMPRECECFVPVKLEVENGNKVIRISMPEEWGKEDLINRSGITRVTVTLHGDWIIDTADRTLDGNPLRVALPSGNNTAGGDWISVIRVAR